MLGYMMKQDLRRAVLSLEAACIEVTKRQDIPPIVRKLLKDAYTCTKAAVEEVDGVHK